MTKKEFNSVINLAQKYNEEVMNCGYTCDNLRFACSDRRHRHTETLSLYKEMIVGDNTWTLQYKQHRSGVKEQRHCMLELFRLQVLDTGEYREL